MAIRFLNVGASEDLVRIDDTDIYSDGLPVGSFRTDLQGYMEQEPTHDNHVVRLLDLNEAVVDIGNADALGTGVVSYERGGLNADISSFGGILRVSGGATSYIPVAPAIETFLRSINNTEARSNLGITDSGGGGGGTPIPTTNADDITSGLQ